MRDMEAPKTIRELNPNLEREVTDGGHDLLKDHYDDAGVPNPDVIDAGAHILNSNIVAHDTGLVLAKLGAMHAFLPTESHQESQGSLETSLTNPSIRTDGHVLQRRVFKDFPADSMSQEIKHVITLESADVADDTTGMPAVTNDEGVTTDTNETSGDAHSTVIEYTFKREEGMRTSKNGAAIESIVSAAFNAEPVLGDISEAIKKGLAKATASVEAEEEQMSAEKTLEPSNPNTETDVLIITPEPEEEEADSQLDATLSAVEDQVLGVTPDSATGPQRENTEAATETSYTPVRAETEAPALTTPEIKTQHVYEVPQADTSEKDLANLAKVADEIAAASNSASANITPASNESTNVDISHAVLPTPVEEPINPPSESIGKPNKGLRSFLSDLFSGKVENNEPERANE